MKTIAILLLVLCATACNESIVTTGKKPLIVAAKALNDWGHPYVMVKDANGNYDMTHPDEALVIYDSYEVGDTIR